MRGLSQLEAHALQRQRGAAGMLSGGSLGGGGPVLTVFDLLMAHYTLPAQHATAQHAPAQHLQHGRVSVTPYSAALWRDPQVGGGGSCGLGWGVCMHTSCLPACCQRHT
jgi:hypothetical protein